MPKFFLYIESLTMGFAIAAPVGPVSMICMRVTLTQGMKKGIAAGLGAATADGIYAAIAGFSLSIFSKILLDCTFWLRLVACLYLIYLGVTFLSKKPNFKNAQKEYVLSSFKAFISTFIFTLASPMTILSFVSLFTSLKPNSSQSFSDKIVMILGVFTGSIIWWCILVRGLGFAHERLSDYFIQKINQISGLIILSFALYILLEITLFKFK